MDLYLIYIYLHTIVVEKRHHPGFSISSKSNSFTNTFLTVLARVRINIEFSITESVWSD